MFEAGNFHRRAFAAKAFTRCLAAVVLLCLHLGSLNSSHAEIAHPPDQVFCPLQKTWVKKGRADFSPEKQKAPLENICASVGQKTDFLERLSGSLRFTRARPSEREKEKLFFD